MKKKSLPSQYELNKRWDFILATMIMGNPFIHEFLMMMSKKSDTLCPTMGIRAEGSRIFLLYNPIFMNKLTDEEVRWVLNHEVYHVALHHCTLRKPEDPEQYKIWNYAMDLAINQMISETGTCRKPREEVIKPLFPDQFGFPPKLSMEQYLQLLWKKKEEDKKNNEEGNSGENSNKDGSENNNKGVTGLPKAPGGGEVVDDHNGFEESPILDQVLRQKIEEMLNQSKYWGNMPGDIKEAIEAAQKAQIKWTKYLRHELGRFAIDEREPTIMKPNRRFGYPYCGTTTKHVEKVLWCEDTSGSMSDRALAKARAEANKALQYMPIDMVQFDTKIQYGPAPFDKKTKRFEAHGRGGTDFQEVMDLAEKGRYKAIVILTDGGAAPPTRPRGVRDVIWCIIEGNNPPVDWGKVVKIKDTPF